MNFDIAKVYIYLYIDRQYQPPQKTQVLGYVKKLTFIVLNQAEFKQIMELNNKFIYVV